MLADFSEKGNQIEEPVHVINMNVVDNPEVWLFLYLSVHHTSMIYFICLDVCNIKVNVINSIHPSICAPINLDICLNSCKESHDIICPKLY